MRRANVMIPSSSNCYPACFITVGTFGKRVPGDVRGAFRSNGEFVSANGSLENSILSRITQPRVSFNDFERKLAFGGVADACYKHGITVGALNVQVNHFHLLAYSTTKTAAEIYGFVVRAASFRLNAASPRVSELKRIWQHKYDARIVYGPADWLRYMRYALEKQTSCDYMNEQEWLWRSSIWKSNPFNDNLNRRVEFDCRVIRFVEPEFAVKRTKPKTVTHVTKWD